MLQPGDRAPEIALEDLEGRIRRPLSVEAGSRGSALLVFYKDSCPTCRYTLPFVERVHREIGPRGARLFAVAQDDAARSKAMASELGLSLPILVDAPGYATSVAYGIQTVPSLFLIGEGAVVKRSFAGFSKRLLAEIASEAAASIGAPAPAIYAPGEEVLETKPG